MRSASRRDFHGRRWRLNDSPRRRRYGRLYLLERNRLGGILLFAWEHGARRSDLLPVSLEADSTVIRSRSEGKPNVILDAWSQGLGVPAIAVGGVLEMVEHERSGMLVPFEGPGTLAAVLFSAPQNPR